MGLPGPAAARPVAACRRTSSRRSIRLSALLQWLPLAGAALRADRAAASRLSRVARRLPASALVVALAVAVLVVDLFRANMGFNPAIPIEHADEPVSRRIRYLQERIAPIASPAWGDAGPDPAARTGPGDALRAVRRARLRLPRGGALRQALAGQAGPGGEVIPPTTLALPTEESLRTLSLLSVTNVMQDPTNAPLRLPGLAAGIRRPRRPRVPNENALPRAFLVDRQRTVSGEDAALAAVTDPSFDGVASR